MHLYARPLTVFRCGDFIIFLRVCPPGGHHLVPGSKVRLTHIDDSLLIDLVIICIFPLPSSQTGVFRLL